MALSLYLPDVLRTEIEQIKPANISLSKFVQMALLKCLEHPLTEKEIKEYGTVLTLANNTDATVTQLIDMMRLANMIGNASSNITTNTQTSITENIPSNTVEDIPSNIIEDTSVNTVEDIPKKPKAIRQRSKSSNSIDL